MRRLIVVLAGFAVLAVMAASAGFSASTVIIKRTLTVSVSGSGQLVSSPRGISCSATCSARFRSGTRVRLIAVASTGWTLSGWGGACRGAGSCVVRLTSARVVLVTFTRVQQTQPPVAVPGHYVGKTADNEAWAFDIGGDGLSLLNLQTGQMNESCNPPNHLYGGQLSFKGPIAVARDGSFTINTTLSGTVGSSAATAVVAITGRTADGVANGTYRLDTSYSADGIGYSCTTGVQSWTASRIP